MKKLSIVLTFYFVTSIGFAQSSDTKLILEKIESLRQLTESRFQAVDKRFEDLMAYSDKRFEDMNTRFEGINTRFEDLMAYSDKRFEDMNARFTSIDTQFDQVYNMLIGLLGLNFVSPLILYF